MPLSSTNEPTRSGTSRENQSSAPTAASKVTSDQYSPAKYVAAGRSPSRGPARPIGVTGSFSEP